MVHYYIIYYIIDIHLLLGFLCCWRPIVLLELIGVGWPTYEGQLTRTHIVDLPHAFWGLGFPIEEVLPVTGKDVAVSLIRNGFRLTTLSLHHTLGLELRSIGRAESHSLWLIVCVVDGIYHLGAALLRHWSLKVKSIRGLHSSREGHIQLI